MGAAPIRSNEELWERVAMVREGLRAAGTTAEAQRLHDAITVSGYPGEVWPETRDVLRELLRERPARSRGVTPD